MSDSRVETHKHIARVRELIGVVIVELIKRQSLHDKSKLESPEVEVFEKYTPILSGLTYGSEEYKKCLDEMKPALRHHYDNNRHHPEFHQRGISGMNLVDLIEMFCDWKAATERHADGDMRKSIEINQSRFHYVEQLAHIFKNTIPILEEIDV